MLSDLRPCQPVLNLVDRARKAGIATAVLSNSWRTGSYDPYAGYDLESRFDAVVISDQVGLRKPDETIYRLAAETLDVAPSTCVFVDDTAHNLPPAYAGRWSPMPGIVMGRQGQPAVSGTSRGLSKSCGSTWPEPVFLAITACWYRP
jgi:FMN phosphatase YigB (HAD superfamily)